MSCAIQLVMYAALTCLTDVKRKAEEDLPSPGAPKRARHSDSEEPQDEALEEKEDDQLDLINGEGVVGSNDAGDEADGDDDGADDGIEDAGEDGADDKDDGKDDDDKEEKDDDKDGDNDDEDKDEGKDDDKNSKDAAVEAKSDDKPTTALKRIPFPDKVRIQGLAASNVPLSNLVLLA